MSSHAASDAGCIQLSSATNRHTNPEVNLSCRPTLQNALPVQSHQYEKDDQYTLDTFAPPLQWTLPYASPQSQLYLSDPGSASASDSPEVSFSDFLHRYTTGPATPPEQMFSPAYGVSHHASESSVRPCDILPWWSSSDHGGHAQHFDPNTCSALPHDMYMPMLWDLCSAPSACVPSGSSNVQVNWIQQAREPEWAGSTLHSEPLRETSDTEALFSASLGTYDIVQSEPSLTTGRRPTPDISVRKQNRRFTAVQRKERDELLLKLRNKGLSYKQIIEVGQFNETESTLRGRMRVLTKPADAKRKMPNWPDEDVAILQRIVKKELVRAPIRNRKTFTRRGYESWEYHKIPWSTVAVMMKEADASYPYGPGSCSKKWATLTGSDDTVR